jgi:hypothetical protein
MADHDVTQILVAGQKTGIIGLTEVLRSTAETHAGRKDDEVREILGPGCSNCRKLEQDLMTRVGETKIPADIDHMTDLKEIGSYRVMGSPALIINGKLMAVGNMPPKSRLKAWLFEAATATL